MFISLGIASSILGFISGFLYFFLYMALGGIQPRSFLYSAFAFVSFYGFKLLKEKSKKGLLLVFTGCVGMYFSEKILILPYALVGIFGLLSAIDSDHSLKSILSTKKMMLLVVACIVVIFIYGLLSYFI